MTRAGQAEDESSARAAGRRARAHFIEASARKKPIGDAMTSELTAHEIVDLLKLEPNATCGFVRVTYVAKQTLAAGALPLLFERGGPLGSGLYFLVTPESPVRLHRI